MKVFFTHLRDIAISGFFALLPLYVLFIVIAKAWKSLSRVGAGIAGMFGMKPILGVGGTTIFSGLLVITLWIVIGLLVRFSFMAALSRAAERAMSKYIPGYDTYKVIAEEKLHHKVRALDYTSAFDPMAGVLATCVHRRAGRGRNLRIVSSRCAGDQ